MLVPVDENNLLSKSAVYVMFSLYPGAKEEPEYKANIML